MSRRQFTWLLGAAVAAVLAVVLLVPREAGKPADGDPRLLPDLADRVNDVTRIAVVAPGGTEAVTLERGQHGWTVVQLGDYPADWPKVRALLRDLAEAEVIEPKTANPDYHARLGVQDIGADGATGVLVRVGGDQAVGVVVGDAPSGREGRYVRLEDSAQALLIDRDLQLPPAPVEWARREIVDLPAANVQEVEILHPDGDRVLVGKPGPEATDFALLNVPDGREAQGGWANNQLGGAFSRLRADDIRVDDLAGEPPPGNLQAPVRVRVLSFDGLELIGELYTLGDEASPEHWLRLSAARPGASPDEAGPSDGESEPSGVEPDLDDLRARTEGWLFRLPAFKADGLNRRLEDLLKPAGSDA